MNKISKYFDESSKKRDISGESNPEEERKERKVQKLTIQMIPLMMKFFRKLIAQVISQKY